MLEMIDDSCKVAHGPEQAMQKDQGFSLALFYEFELSIPFNFVW
jgi:hypothetical protein